uniref:DUF5641 domain-containing protein n=1 Tax=Amphimedon queenslandica TaxID=400682 RepID=A0A1X7TPH5_AMPQE
MRHLSYTLDGFWKRWTSQYLIGLRENHSYITTRSKGTEYIEVGDMMRKNRDDSGCWVVYRKFSPGEVVKFVALQ